MPTEVTVMSKYKAFADKFKKAEGERDLYRPPANTPDCPSYRCRVTKVLMTDGTFSWNTPKPGGNLPAVVVTVSYEIESDDEKLDGTKWTGKLWTMPNADEADLERAFNCKSPAQFQETPKGSLESQYQRANIVLSQFKGLVDTLLDREGEDYDVEAEIVMLQQAIDGGKVVMVEVVVKERKNQNNEMIFDREKILRRF